MAYPHRYRVVVPLAIEGVHDLVPQAPVRWHHFAYHAATMFGTLMVFFTFLRQWLSDSSALLG